MVPLTVPPMRLHGPHVAEDRLVAALVLRHAFAHIPGQVGLHHVGVAVLIVLRLVCHGVQVTTFLSEEHTGVVVDGNDEA